jgi:hypothetical protein
MTAQEKFDLGALCSKYRDHKSRFENLDGQINSMLELHKKQENFVEGLTTNIQKLKPIYVHFLYNNSPDRKIDEVCIGSYTLKEKNFYEYLANNNRFRKFIKYFENTARNLFTFQIRYLPKYCYFMLKPTAIYQFDKMEDIRDIISNRFENFTENEKFEFDLLLTIYELNCEFELRNKILISNSFMYDDNTRESNNSFNLLASYYSSISGHMNWNPKIGYYQSKTLVQKDD